jgi:exopolysaccharide biosynthesis polyprenyl glycosylphosphotransferase
MMNSRAHYFNLLLLVFVYSLPLFAFGASSYVKFGDVLFPPVHSGVPRYYLILFLFTELAWILAANYYKLSSVEDLFWEHTGIRAAFRACFATFLLQTALLVFDSQLIVSRAFILLSNAFLFLMVVAGRNFFRLSATSTRWPRKYEKVLIVGTDQYARRCVKLLRRIPFFNCEITGYLQLQGQPVLVHDAPVFCGTEPQHLNGLNFDEVVVALPARRYLQVSSIVDNLQMLGKPIRAILDLGPRLSLREKLFQAGRMQMMNVAISPVESSAYTVLKRTFDVVAATLGILLLSPLFLVIAVLVKLNSPGPVLFLQERVGRQGRHFTLLKFRTMHCSSQTESDTLWTTQNDPRCTSIGSILRRFSLDELPQLFNVIRGDMSLVGPRPERPYYVARFGEDLQRYNIRHCCEVGMTGWAQVNGLRGDTSISDRLQYDLYYVHNWSFGLDLEIIARTMFIALTGENAH